MADELPTSVHAEPSAEELLASRIVHLLMHYDRITAAKDWAVVRHASARQSPCPQENDKAARRNSHFGGDRRTKQIL